MKRAISQVSCSCVVVHCSLSILETLVEDGPVHDNKRRELDGDAIIMEKIDAELNMLRNSKEAMEQVRIVIILSCFLYCYRSVVVLVCGNLH